MAIFSLKNGKNSIVARIQHYTKGAKNMIIHIPWPSRDLSPNARVHWAKKAKAAKAYRRDCYFAAKAAMAKSGDNIAEMAATGVTLSITFHPATSRAYDLDNALASIKSGLDGVSDAIGVDDSRWALKISKGAQVRGGAVEITIAPQ